MSQKKTGIRSAVEMRAYYSIAMPRSQVKLRYKCSGRPCSALMMPVETKSADLSSRRRTSRAYRLVLYTRAPIAD